MGVCGIAGLFVGCPALAVCPHALRSAGPPAAAATGPVVTEPASTADGDYRSPLRGWFDRATVRQSARRELDSGTPRLYFTPELVPVARHELVRASRPDVYAEVLVQHLYRYLDFTAKLEHLVVNRTALGIAYGSVGTGLPEEMRFDALKIYTDEAYHALFSVDLARQVRAVSGVAPRLPAEPYFLRRLRELRDAEPAPLRPLVEVLFVIVSETLISATLAAVPDDPDVEPAVRAAVRDHAVDEGRHHAYFALFLRHLWGQLDGPVRHWAGGLVPRLVAAFLHPDLAAIRAELRGYGLSRDDAEQVLAETFPGPVVRGFARDTARQTVHHFSALGAFDAPRARDELARYGLD
jgi:P-aminobenzoate N-oxygenase AurF